MYKKMALLIHPDKCSDERAEAAFKALATAYEMLVSPQTQANYLATYLKQPMPSTNVVRESKRKYRTAQQVWEAFEREEEMFIKTQYETREVEERRKESRKRKKENHIY